MNTAALGDPRSQREIWLLTGLAFFLPLFEAPKNLLWLAYLGLWGWHGMRGRGFGGAWRGVLSWDGVIALTLVLSLAGTALSGIKANEWVGVRDLFRYLPLLWVLSRSEYSQAQWRTVLTGLVLGSVLATLWGCWVWWQSGVAEMGLHSVGHSNHSATYLCIVFAVALALALVPGGSPQANGKHRSSLAMWLAAGVLAFGVLATGSRVGVVVTALLALALPLVLAVSPGKRRRPLIAVVVVAAVCAGVIAVSQPWVLRKHLRNVNDQNVLAYRDHLWRQALTAWRAHPVWGVGMDNFARIDVPRLHAWEREQGRPLSPPDIYQSVHAHSLYLDALSERGLAGAASLGALFLLWGVTLWQRRPWRPLARADNADFVPWSIAAAAAFVTLSIGLVNTTLHTELALAAVICLGALLVRQSPAA